VSDPVAVVDFEWITTLQHRPRRGPWTPLSVENSSQWWLQDVQTYLFTFRLALLSAAGRHEPQIIFGAARSKEDYLFVCENIKWLGHSAVGVLNPKCHGPACGQVLVAMLVDLQVRAGDSSTEDAPLHCKFTFDSEVTPRRMVWDIVGQSPQDSAPSVQPLARSVFRFGIPEGVGLSLPSVEGLTQEFPPRGAALKNKELGPKQLARLRLGAGLQQHKQGAKGSWPNILRKPQLQSRRSHSLQPFTPHIDDYTWRSPTVPSAESPQPMPLDASRRTPSGRLAAPVPGSSSVRPPGPLHMPCLPRRSQLPFKPGDLRLEFHSWSERSNESASARRPRQPEDLDGSRPGASERGVAGVAPTPREEEDAAYMSLPVDIREAAERIVLDALHSTWRASGAAVALDIEDSAAGLEIPMDDLLRESNSQVLGLSAMVTGVSTRGDAVPPEAGAADNMSGSRRPSSELVEVMSDLGHAFVPV